MADTQDTSQSSGAVTVAYDFHNASSNRDQLFSVRAGIPISDAFDQLSILIATAQNVVSELEDGGACAGWILELSYALTQSIHMGVNQGGKP